jgi:hypothetical protein
MKNFKTKPVGLKIKTIGKQNGSESALKPKLCGTISSNEITKHSGSSSPVLLFL